MTRIFVIKEGKYTLFNEADSLEQAEAMNPFRIVKAREPDETSKDVKKVLTADAVRSILASPGSYTALGKQFGVSTVTISKDKRRVVRANVQFDGEVATSSSPRGRKPKGTQ